MAHEGAPGARTPGAEPLNELELGAAVAAAAAALPRKTCKVTILNIYSTTTMTKMWLKGFG